MDTSLPTNNSRVLIVADDPLARAGLAALLADRPGFSVVGQVSGQADLLSEVAMYRPAVVLWDLGMNAAPSLERLTAVREANTPVVAMLPDAAHAAEVWSMGVRGLLLRDVSATALRAALKAVHEGLIVLAPELAAKVPTNQDRGSASLPEELTPREMDVLRLLAEGLPNKMIAQRLGVSEHTVKFHLNAIMGKLEVQSRTEAVVAATRLGLILL